MARTPRNLADPTMWREHRQARQRTTHLEGLALVLLGIGLSALVTHNLLRSEARRPQTVVLGTVCYDGQPIEGAVVTVDQHTGLRATTDKFGSFELGRAPVGCQTLLIQKGKLQVGYPVKLRPSGETNLGRLPLYQWRPHGPAGQPGHETRETVILR